MAQTGFLLIADITGYTSFISHSELEPAAEHLQSFLNLLISHTKPPLKISRLEGDAVISYALEGSFLQGQTLVEMIEETYVAFRRALELFVINNACDCNACTYIPSLDIKFFVHYGEFLMQPFPSYTELIGNDVNLIHRLTKNTITEQTGIKAYIAYSGVVVDKLDLTNLIKDLVKHEEIYDHIGSVPVFVQDIHPLWERKKAEIQVGSTSKDALFSLEQNFSVDPILMWDYVTQPEIKAILSQSNSVTIKQKTDGRLGEGTVYECLTGDSESIETIVSWIPPSEYSFDTIRRFGVKGRTTIQITPNDGGSKVTITVSKGSGNFSALLSVFDSIYKRNARLNLENSFSTLQNKIKTGETVLSPN